MNTTYPLISVVIPFYSTDSGRLKISVISALEQTYSNIEVIIIDDHSPISAVDELKEIVDGRLKILRNDTNKNGAYSRNRGMAEAKGEFIALLDSDDYWKKEHLETNLKEIKDADFIYSNVIELTSTGTVYYREASDVRDYKDKAICNILFDSPPQTNSFFFRRECYPEVKFDETLKRHQDYQFFVDFIKSSYTVKKANHFTSFYSINERQSGKKIDYSSVIYFWEQRQKEASAFRLKTFLFGISYKILNQDKRDAYLLKEIKDRILIDDKSYAIITAIKPLKLQEKVLYIYYYFYLDGKNLSKKLIRAAKRMRSKL